MDLNEYKRKAAPCGHEQRPNEPGCVAGVGEDFGPIYCEGFSQTTWDSLVEELIEAVGMDEHYERHDPEQQDKPWCGNCYWEWPCPTYTALRRIQGEETDPGEQMHHALAAERDRMASALKAQGHYEMKQGDYPSICGVCSRFYKPAKWPCPAAQALAAAEGSTP